MKAVIVMLVLPDGGADGICQGVRYHQTGRSSRHQDNQRLPRVTSPSGHGHPHTLTGKHESLTTYHSFSVTRSAVQTRTPALQGGYSNLMLSGRLSVGSEG